MYKSLHKTKRLKAARPSFIIRKKKENNVQGIKSLNTTQDTKSYTGWPAHAHSCHRHSSLREELVLRLVPRVPVDLLVCTVDGREGGGSRRRGLLLFVGLLPGTRALGQRALVLDVLDPPVVADALCRLEVLLRDGGVVLVGGAEARGGGLVLVGEGFLRDPVAVLVVVWGVDDAGRRDRLLALALFLGLGLDEIGAGRS